MKNYTIEELRQFSPDELNVMLEEQQISWSEWVEAQPDTYNGYPEWLKRKDFERNDESAQLFVREIEETMMDEEKSDIVNSVLDAMNK